MRGERVAEVDASRQVIARAASVLRSLENAPSGLTIARITRACGLPRTTVTRLVNSLQAEQFVAVNGNTIRLGPAVMRLATAAHLDAAKLVRPHIEALSQELQETVDLWIERAFSAELIEEAVSDREVRIVAAPGFKLSLSTTAPGKAFLACLSNDEIARRIEGRLDARTPHSVTSIDALIRDIDKTRQTGVAFDLEEHAEDVCAVAMIVDLGLTDRYAISIPTPARRFHEARAILESGLRRCVQAIEAAC